MDFIGLLKDKKFVRLYLLLTMCLAAAALVLDFAAYLSVSAVQWIAAILLIAMHGILFLLVVMLYLNLNRTTELGKRMKLLNYVLLLLIMFVPLLISAYGALASMGLYFVLSVETNGALLGEVLIVLMTLLLLGYGIALSLFCFLKFNEKDLWN